MKDLTLDELILIYDIMEEYFKKDYPEGPEGCVNVKELMDKILNEIT